MSKINSKQRRHVAIDIGTSKTRIFIDSLGMVFNEASVIALNYKTKKVIAVGDEAKKLIGKVGADTKVKPLLSRGVLTDLKLLKTFLSHILTKHKDEIKDSLVTLACPISMVKLERNALIEAIKSLDVAYVVAEDDIKMALLGAGYDIYSPVARLCLDMGAGKSTIGIITSDETVNYRWTKAAGEIIDNEIIKFLKAKENILVGDTSAESIKISVGSLVKSKEPLKTKAYGHNLNSAMPQEIEIFDKDISKVIISVFGNIASIITNLLEDTSTELASDIIKNGIVVTGGLAKLSGVKLFFENFFEIPIQIAKNASSATIEGAIANRDKIFEQFKNIENNKKNKI